jgi:hypothetical protein
MIHDDYGNRRFYGIYRGTVVDNNDPLNQVRLKVKVPQILFDQVTDWAWSVQQPGVARTIPQIGDGVWVSFEGGDPSYPIWVGSFKIGTETTVTTASTATNIVGGGQGRIPVQSAANTTGFTGAPAAAGQVLVSALTSPYAAWGYPTPYKILSGKTTGGAVSVTFSTSFATGVEPIVVASVLSTNTKPEIFVLNTVDNLGFTGQVWSSSGTVSPYNNFVTAVSRTVYWVAIQLTP